MLSQKSFQKEKPALYLVATPIGNLEDMTYRAVRILQEVQAIYAEDTRNSRILLNHYHIKTPLYSYHEFNKTKASEDIFHLINHKKSVALISDAGMPLISDPGYLVVQKAITLAIPVIPIPGCNAALSALIVSGISSEPFLFYGFLDSKPQKRLKQLTTLKTITNTLIFYESPHRINKMLADLLTIFGDRKISIARELTKKFEEILRGTISELIDYTYKGELVVVVEGATTNLQTLTIEEHLAIYDNIQIPPKEIIKLVATERQIPKNEVYKIYHKIKENNL